MSSRITGLAALALHAGLLGGSAAAQGGEAPAFAELLRTAPRLRAELLGRHPRLFFDGQGLAAVRKQAASHPEAWRVFLSEAIALREDPPPAPAQQRGAHYRVGLALPEPAFAFAVTRERRHLEQARRWVAAAMAYEPWGYTFSKPNQDIPAGHLLYGLSFAYDLLHDDLAPEERKRIRSKIAEKAALLHDAYRPKPGRRYSYSQNHTYINAAAIGFAGIVLAGEHPSAQGWLAFMRAVFERVARTYSPDGYYYEGYHYFEFGAPWIVHALDALEHATGEKYYERLRLDLAPRYVAHSLLPGGLLFDFGDTGRGAADRAKGSMEILGAQGILHRLARRYQDPQATAIATRADRLAKATREPLWSLLWQLDAPKAPSESFAFPLVQHFENAGAVFWRRSWDDEAEALALRCGPPEGHHVAPLQPLLPDWRLSTGHAHPDAGSFILLAGGRYLTGDAGYTGVKLTEHHNTLLVDGRGQEREGRHEVFRDLPYERLNRIRIRQLRQEGAALSVTCDLAAAYPPELGLTRLERSFEIEAASFRISDAMESDTPRALAALLHADRPPRSIDARTFAFDSGDGGGGGGVTLQVRVEEPQAFGASVEPQWVIAQGRPGSVEQGEREQRGYRLTLQAPPSRFSRIVVKLTLIEGSRP